MPTNDDFVDVEHLKKYMAVSPEEKLEILEEMRDFFGFQCLKNQKKSGKSFKKRAGEHSLYSHFS